MRRGAVSYPLEVYSLDGGSGLELKNCLSTTDLRYFCLYWDELIIPDMEFLKVDIEGQNDFIKNGFLSRPNFSLSLNEGETVPFDFHLLRSVGQQIKKEICKKKKSTHWFEHNIGDSESSDELCDADTPSLRIDLLRALPVPAGDIKADQIITFKNKRRPELDAVHEYVQELYQEVINSADPDLSKASAYHRLESSINNLNRTFTERWRESFRYDLSFNKDLSAGDIYTAVMGSQALKLALEGQMVPAVIQGSAGVIPNILSRVTFKKQSEQKTERSRLKYISKASDAGLIKL